jgi:hypothetical protein
MAAGTFTRQFLLLCGLTAVLLVLAYHGLWRWALGLDDALHLREFSAVLHIALVLHLVYVGFRRKPLRELWTRDLGYQVLLVLGGILVVLGSQRIRAGYYPVLRPLPWLGLLLLAARGLMVGVRHHFPARGWKSGLATSIWASISLLMLAELVFTQVAETHGSVKTLANLTWHARYGRPLNSFGAADIEHDPADLRDPNKKTLLYLGDSFTAGAGLKDYQHTRYSSLVTNRRCKQVHWNHVNLGIGGANQVLEKEMLARFDFPYEVAVVSYYINDIFPVAEALGKAKEIDPFDYQGYDPVSRFVIDHSYFLNWAFWRFPHVVEADYLGELLRLHDDPEVYQQHLTELDALLQAVESGTSSRHTTLVLLFPMLKDISRQHAVLDRLAQWLLTRGVAVMRVDRIPELTKTPWRYIVNRNDLHPNEALHALVADKISRRLENGLEFDAPLCMPRGVPPQDDSLREQPVSPPSY